MMLGDTILIDDNKQGSEGWHAIRRGRITGSRAKDARDRLKGGGWSQKAIGYAYDVARQRLGGKTPEVFSNQYMRAGTENEPVARMKYEGLRGVMVEETGFAYTADGKFGCSPDGVIAPGGLWECKTMVSSATLFDALVSGDVSEYRDQCLFEMWLLRADWVDLTLFCPDLELMRVVRIERNEGEIDALVADMMKFEALVESCVVRLREAVDLFALRGLPGFEPEDAERAEVDAARAAAEAKAREVQAAAEALAVQPPQVAILPLAPVNVSPPPTVQPSAACSDGAGEAGGASAAPAATSGTVDNWSAPQEATMLNMGAICARLGFTLRAEFVAETLGIQWSSTNKAAKLWRESDWPRIKAALVAHITALDSRHADGPVVVGECGA